MNDEYSLEELAPWMVGAITLIGGLLRVFQLGTKGMWLDETFSVWLANQGVGDMLQWIVKIDQHPPCTISYFTTGLPSTGIHPMPPASFLCCSAQPRSRSCT
ncbi:MAG: hypothetical protein U0X20_21545 [Caldilineaceae bacterium]